jgi:hypothetical protein
MAQTRTVTLSSVGTAVITLDTNAKSTTVALSAASSGAVQLDMSLDDPSALTLAGLSSTNIVWALLSSNASMNSSNLASGLIYTVLSPVSMVRINSTALVSGGSYTLKALQSVTA